MNPHGQNQSAGGLYIWAEARGGGEVCMCVPTCAANDILQTASKQIRLYLNGAEGLRKQVLQLRGHDQQASALVVLFEDLADAGVGQQAPLDHQQKPPMQVDEASVDHLPQTKAPQPTAQMSTT